MNSFQRYQQEKKKLLQFADMAPNTNSARWLVQQAREMVIAEMRYKANKEMHESALFGLGFEWDDWIRDGGSKK